MRRPRGPAKWGELWIVRKFSGYRWVFRRDPWRGLSRPVATPLCAYCGCPECEAATQEVEALKKPEPKAVGHDSPQAPVETPRLLAKLPCTVDLLLQPAWEDGCSKEGVCLFVFPSVNLVKLLVKIGSPPLKLLVQGRTWDEAWAALELVLKGDDVPWEQDNGSPKKGVKKK